MPFIEMVGPQGLRGEVPVPALGRHAAACQPRPGADRGPRDPAHGRALRCARRADPGADAGWSCCASGSEANKTVLFITHQIDEAIFLSDRVVVMSARPGRILADIPIDIPRPRELEVKRTPRFVELADQIWQLVSGQLAGSCPDRRLRSDDRTRSPAAREAGARPQPGHSSSHPAPLRPDPARVGPHRLRDRASHLGAGHRVRLHQAGHISSPTAILSVAVQGLLRDRLHPAAPLGEHPGVRGLGSRSRPSRGSRWAWRWACSGGSSTCWTRGWTPSMRHPRSPSCR